MTFWRTLIPLQVAVSLVMISGAALFVRTLHNLRTADVGYRRDGLLCLSLFPQPGSEKISNRALYYRSLTDKVRQIPGVEAASYFHSGLLRAWSNLNHEFRETVSVLPSASHSAQASTGVVGPSFFQLIGMRVLAGREFTWDDNEENAKVAVISDSLARRLFPDQNPLGQRIAIAGLSEGEDLRIVGVVNSARLWRVQSREPPAVYITFLQIAASNQPVLSIRTSGDPPLFAHAAETAVQDLGRHYSVLTQSLTQRLDTSLSNERIVATLSTFLSFLALVLAAIGLYGTMWQAVIARTTEIGIRMALGAQRRSILILFLREAATVVAVGLAFGIPGTLIAAKLVSSMFFGVSLAGFDSIALPAVILVVAGLLATCIPATRASRIEPKPPSGPNDRSTLPSGTAA